MQPDHGVASPPTALLPLALAELPHPVLCTSADGIVLGSNTAAARVFGVARAPLEGRSLDVCFGPETSVDTVRRVHEAIRSGGTLQCELRAYRGAGTPFWADVTIWSEPSADKGGRTAYVMLSDLTDRHEAVASRALGNARLGFVLDRVQAGITVHKATTEILYANAHATELLGVSHESIVGAVNSDPRWSLVDEAGELLPIEEYPVNRAVRTGAVIRDACVGTRRASDEPYVWLMCNAYPIIGDDGVPTEVVVSFTDVTALKAAERAMQKSEERLRLVLQGSTDAPWDWDIVNNELYYSPRWWQMIGHEPNDGARQTDLWIPLLHPDDRERVTQKIEHSFAHGASSYEVEARLQHKAGHYITVLSRGFITRDANGAPLRASGTNTDVTERRAMEARLSRTQRMEAIGQLAGGVAHDFNNLLAVILGNLELLRDDVADRADLRELLEEAASAARRGADLTRRLLASTRQQTLQPTVLHVESVIENVEQVLRRLISESIRVETQVPSALTRVRIDGGQLENALLNLAINARDAMPRGGTLTIAASNCTISDQTSPSDVELQPGAYVRIIVTDTGDGMTREVIDRALEPFFTTKPIGQGTGLGLSMVYGFVRQSGGNLKIYSRPGSGTSVQLYLPATDAVPAQEPEDPVEMPRASAARKDLILVVEDDAHVRRFCVRCLESLGYAVLEAADGPAALTALAAQPTVDLLLTDVVMPGGMTGPMVVEEARRLVPNLPALYMSGYPAQELDMPSARTAATLIAKPFSKADLAQRVRDLLDARTPAADGPV